MIADILTLLKDAPIGQYEHIDKAKGRHKLPENYNEFKKHLKWRLRKK
jgi:hypothetical protein